MYNTWEVSQLGGDKGRDVTASVLPMVARVMFPALLVPIALGQPVRRGPGTLV